MPGATAVGDISLVWGESLRWDDRRQRLYFVDCGAQTLHWLDGAEPPLQTRSLSGTPTGVVLCDDGRLVVALDEGLSVVDVDDGSIELLTPYPDELGGRANDAAADLDGNLVTGTLNLGPGPGSYWWFSATRGWRLLDDGIGNANGPVVMDNGDGTHTLVFADTNAGLVYAYPYDGKAGTVGARSTFADVNALAGLPDGACADSDDGVWSCVVGAGLIARYKSAGLQTTIETGVEMPSDVTFGGADLDRMFFVSIAVSIGGIEVSAPNAGKLMVLDDSGFQGRVEPRFQL